MNWEKAAESVIQLLSTWVVEKILFWLSSVWLLKLARWASVFCEKLAAGFWEGLTTCERSFSCPVNPLYIALLITLSQNNFCILSIFLNLIETDCSSISYSSSCRFINSYALSRAFILFPVGTFAFLFRFVFSWTTGISNSCSARLNALVVISFSIKGLSAEEVGLSSTPISSSLFSLEICKRIIGPYV